MAKPHSSNEGPRGDSPIAASGRGTSDARVSVPVLLPLRLPGPYHYAVAPGVTLQPGDIVRVPFGKRAEIGVVWESDAAPPAGVMLKVVGERLDAPPLAADQRRFVDWVAAYTLTPVGMVLKMVLAVPEACEPPKRMGTRTFFLIASAQRRTSR